MGREIKFRAWHKKYKRMYSVSDLHMATLMNGGIWATVNGRNPIEDKEIKIRIQPKDIEVMQYTGLKDQNGGEIYEGDIVEERWANPLAGGENVDRYNIELAESTLYVMKHSSGQQRWDRHLFMRFKEVEVIGNIYENPELLGDTHD